MEPTAVLTKPTGRAHELGGDEPTAIASESQLAALTASMIRDELDPDARAAFASLDERAAQEGTLVDSYLIDRIVTERALARGRLGRGRQGHSALGAPQAVALVQAPRLGKYRLLRLLASGHTSNGSPSGLLGHRDRELRRGAAPRSLAATSRRRSEARHRPFLPRWPAPMLPSR
jgi:hypothetical protein